MPSDAVPFRLEHLPGGDIAMLKGRESRDVVVAFTCWHQNWDTLRTPAAFDFVGTVARSRNDAILLRDVSNRWYQNGIPGATGSVIEIARTLEPHLRLYDRVITLGSSMGGYAALLFGALLRADRAIAVVPQIRIGTEAMAEIGDPRWPVEFAAIDASESPAYFRRLDRMALPSCTRFHAVFGDSDRNDNLHFNLVKNHPQIQAHVVAGEEHGGTATVVMKSRMLELLV